MFKHVTADNNLNWWGLEIKSTKDSKGQKIIGRVEPQPRQIGACSFRESLIAASILFNQNVSPFRGLTGDGGGWRTV